MSAQSSSVWSNPFRRVLWGTVVFMLVLLILGSFWGKTLTSESVSVTPGSPKLLDPINMKPQLIGAYRIDARAIVPANQWVTYEVQLKDQQGQVFASARKQAWSEAGTWSEGGESGSWSEKDLKSGLDVRTRKAEPVVVALEVLEYTDTSGAELNSPVTFKVDIKEGAVDTRYLWPGFIVTGILAFLETRLFG